MKALIKIGAIVLTATTAFAEPASAKVDHPIPQFTGFSESVLSALRLNEIELGTPGAIGARPKLQRLAASRTTKRRTKVRVSTRAAKKRRFKRPAYLSASPAHSPDVSVSLKSSVEIHANHSGKGRTDYELADDFAP